MRALLDTLRNLTRRRKAVLTAQALILIYILGWFAQAPEWGAAWIVYALIVGVGGNAVERVAGAVAQDAHLPADLDDQRKFYLTFFGQLLLFGLGLRAGHGEAAGPPEWAAQWIVMGLAAGTGGNVLEHVTAAWTRVGRRKAAYVEGPAAGTQDQPRA